MNQSANLAARLPDDWSMHLATELLAPYWLQLEQFLFAERQQALVYPPEDDVFRAFELTAFADVNIVILGQDPYHGANQAQGLSFSVPDGTAVPPSLRNIFKEQETDLSIRQPPHGCLESWARQGVLLLNSVLTVRAGCAGSHRHQGWEAFTDSVIAQLNRQHEGVVFMLWGKPAGEKAALINPRRHLVLQAPHPSPLSAYRGFLGCRHFSVANDYLQQQGKAPIDWQLPT